MKNHELLDLLGDVNEDYVQAADSKVIRPQFSWRKLAVCAACAALALGAYPVYRAFNPPLHSYTVVEGGGMATLDDVKAPFNGAELSGSEGPKGEDSGQGGIDGAGYDVPGQDAPAQKKAAAQYDNLIKNGGINVEAPNPDWYGGAWIDDSSYPEAKLAVSIVEGFRTPELEAQIEEWCGGEVAFQSVKYALAYLYALQDSAVDAITGSSSGLSCGIGVDVTANCLGVDLYVYGGSVPDAVLAKLAELDPDGDAIRVRVFTGRLDTLTDTAATGPAPAPVDPEARATPATTADGGETVYHGEDAVPGGVTQPQGGTQTHGEMEEGKLAQYDLLPLDK